MGLLGGIRNAGAIFVGAWSSEPLGDYVAGPNHTLPTGGTAVFSNPLSVEEFVKRSSVICYTPEGLLSDAPATQRLAEAEGLWGAARFLPPCDSSRAGTGRGFRERRVAGGGRPDQGCLAGRRRGDRSPRVWTWRLRARMALTRPAGRPNMAELTPSHEGTRPALLGRH